LKKGVMVTSMKNKITIMSLVYSKFRSSFAVSAGRSGHLEVMTVGPADEDPCPVSFQKVGY
jgi:hypothetical protein